MLSNKNNSFKRGLQTRWEVCIAISKTSVYHGSHFILCASSQCLKAPTQLSLFTHIQTVTENPVIGSITEWLDTQTYCIFVIKTVIIWMYLSSIWAIANIYNATGYVWNTLLDLGQDNLSLRVIKANRRSVIKWIIYITGFALWLSKWQTLPVVMSQQGKLWSWG